MLSQQRNWDMNRKFIKITIYVNYKLFTVHTLQFAIAFSDLGVACG